MAEENRHESLRGAGGGFGRAARQNPKERLHASACRIADACCCPAGPRPSVAALLRLFGLPDGTSWLPAAGHGRIINQTVQARAPGGEGASA
jgi:hypothetical protein